MHALFSAPSVAWLAPLPCPHPLQSAASARPAVRPARTAVRPARAAVRAHIHNDHGHQDAGEEGNGFDTAAGWDGQRMDPQHIMGRVVFNDSGLVPAVAQQFDSKEVLMMAWMSADSIVETVRGGRVVYYSRSRKELWRKGDTSGQVQHLRDIIVDCDGDTILLLVDQVGAACHTGRRSCFYRAFRPPGGAETVVGDVLIDPEQLYGDKGRAEQSK